MFCFKPFELEVTPIYIPLAVKIVLPAASIVTVAALRASVTTIFPSVIVTATVLFTASSVESPPLNATLPVSYTIR